MATTSGGTLAVTLTAIDRITAPLSRIQANALRVQTSMGRLAGALGNVTGLTLLANGARNAARFLGQIVPPLGALTAASSIAGVLHLASSWSSFATSLGNTAYRVQSTASGLLVLQGAARLAGVSAEDMASGMEGLGDALSDAVGGRDSTALQYFTMLGVAMRDASGHARTAGEALPEVADGIARIADPRLQARVMSAMRLPASLLPFLKQGAAGLRQWEADARRFGLVTEQGTEAAKAFELAQTRLRMAGEGLVNTISARLAPVLTPLIERLSNWIAANRELIGQRVEEIVTRLAGAVERFVTSGGLERIGDSLAAIGSGIQTVIGWIGGWGNAAMALGGILALRLLAPLTGIVSALGALGAFRLPIWIARLLGVAGGGAVAAGVAGLMGVRRLGEMRAESGADTPEAQAERRGAMGSRGAAGGFYNAPAEDPGGPDAASLTSQLGALLRRQLTPGGAAGRSIRDEKPSDRQRQAFDYFQSQGWSAAQAAGLVANLRHESGAGLNHQASGDGGRAYGVAQWHPDRQRSFRLWAGKDIRASNLTEQLAFVQHELTQGSERRAGEALRSARTPGEAAGVVSRLYERPANREGEAAARAGTAIAMLPRLAAPAPAPGAPVQPPQAAALPASAGGPVAAPDAPAQPPRAAAPQAPASVAAAAAPAPQRVEVTVRMQGAPPGTVVTTRTQEGVRVERPLTGSIP